MYGRELEHLEPLKLKEIQRLDGGGWQGGYRQREAGESQEGEVKNTLWILHLSARSQREPLILAKYPTVKWES